MLPTQRSVSHNRHLLPLLLLLCGVVLTFAAYKGGLAELVRRWIKQEEYGYGFFIPPIAAWLLWRRRSEILALVGNGSWLSIPVMLLAIFLLLTGEYSALFLLIQAGFILALAAMLLAAGGTTLLRLASIPLFLLVLTIPLPYFLEAELSARLQLLSTNLGSDILDWLNIPVYTEGNLIHLGDITLQIQEACSGLRYLYPLLSVGFIVAYLYQARFWQRALVFLSAIPISVLMNVVRIAGTGVLVNQWGPSAGEGFQHEFAGWLIFMSCLIIMAGEILLLELVGQRRHLHDCLSLQAATAGIIRPGPARLAPLLVAIALGGMTLAADLALGQREEYVPPHQDLADFPLTIGAWAASHTDLLEQPEQIIGTSDYLMTTYHQGTMPPIDLYLSYYPSQRKGYSPHSPEVCMPGQGWVISAPTRLSVPLDNGRQIILLRAIISHAQYQQLVYYWFDERGRDITNQYLMKWYLIHDAITTNRTDGGMVRLITPIATSELPGMADRRLRDFLRQIYPLLDNYIPGRNPSAHTE